ncbi:restriction endonuclease subunit S [Tistrella mobilis]|uniref:restriction endonuclease subunit S n=1 Tax=Tistrella mobilis TaxID=171437 RepID=UPI003557D81E
MKSDVEENIDADLNAADVQPFEVSGGASAFPPSVQPGIPKLGRKPRGWTRAPIGEFLEPVFRTAKLVDDERYQLVTAKRSRGGIVPRAILYGRDIHTKTQFYVEANDFLISRRQISHGACGLVPANLDGAVVSNEYVALKPKSGLDLRFLQHLSHSVYFQQTCFHSSIGVHVEKLVFKIEDWLEWEIDVPPMAEQRRIADILDAWDRAIAHTEALIDAKRRRKAELTRRLLHEGGERNGRLGDLAAINPRGPRVSENSSVSFVPMDAVSEDGRLIINLARRRGEIGSGYTGFVDNDVLVAKITPCFENGKGGHVCGLHSGVGFGSTEFHVLRPNDQGDARFIHHHIMAAAFRRNGERYMTGSAGQRRVPAAFIEDYRIPLMDAERRRNAASILDAADNEIGLLQQELRRLTDQKRGLMQKLLSGDMRLSSMEAAE